MRNKRRRIFRRARRAGVNAIGISQYGQRIRPIRQSRRRMNKRAYKRNLYNFSSMIPRFQVYFAGSAGVNTPANLTDYTFNSYKCLETLFTPANWGSGIDNNSVPTTITGPVIVRGGEEKLTIASEAAESIDYKVQLVWLRRGGTIIANGSISKGSWPISTSNHLGNETSKIVKEWQGTLQYTGGSATFVYKPKLKVYKKESFETNGNDCMYWYVYLGNTVTAAANSVVVMKDSSVTVGYLNV